MENTVLPYVLFIALVGVVVGSFLNVVIWRVPRGESVVSPPSHCPGCGTPIAARDNIPLLSWLVLRGRCRHCGESISARYPFVEALTGVLFGAVALVLGISWEVPAYLYLTGLGVALAFIDLDTKRLPNALTLPAYPVTALLLLIPAVLDDMWSAYTRALLGGLALFAFYLVLALLYPAGMGLGDVKLAGVLGMGLAWFGWGALLVGAFLAFLLGGLVGIGLMAARRARRGTTIPFGPFMVAGALVGVLVGPGLATWYVGALLG